MTDLLKSGGVSCNLFPFPWFKMQKDWKTKDRWKKLKLKTVHDYPRYVWNITEEPYDFTTFDVLKFSEMREKISRLYRTIRNLCSIDLWFLLFSKAKK